MNLTGRPQQPRRTGRQVGRFGGVLFRVRKLADPDARRAEQCTKCVLEHRHDDLTGIHRTQSRDQSGPRAGGAVAWSRPGFGVPRRAYPAGMRSLDQATLGSDERAVLERFAATLRERLDGELHATWLFGSRARGESVDALSDIDVLVITDRAGWHDTAPIYQALHDAARDVSSPDLAWTFSLHVHDRVWLADRRAVHSFFVADVDRDRIDVTPSA